MAGSEAVIAQGEERKKERRQAGKHGSCDLHQ